MRKRKSGETWDASGASGERRPFRMACAAFLAVAAGAANALFGGGGGMLIVPALNKCMELEERMAHATAIAVMAPLSLLSVIFLSAKGIGDLSLALWAGLGASIGGALGSLLLKRIPKKLLSVLFYGVMIYAGIKFVR